MTSLNLVTAPAAEPVSLDDMKRHLKIDFADEDDQITDGLFVSRERVELETGRQLITATWELWLDNVPGYPSGHHDAMGSFGFDTGSSSRWLDWSLWFDRGFIDVPCAPLQTVVSIKYVDTSGVQPTWDPTLYQVVAPAGPRAARGRIRPAYGQSWPVTRDQMASLIVQFTCGYGLSGAAVPAMLKRAIKLMGGDLFEHREDTIVTKSRSTVLPLPYGIAQIMSQYRARPITRAA